MEKTKKTSFQFKTECFVSFLYYLTWFFKLLKNKENQPQTPNIWEQKVSSLERVMPGCGHVLPQNATSLSQTRVFDLNPLVPFVPPATIFSPFVFMKKIPPLPIPQLCSHIRGTLWDIYSSAELAKCLLLGK